MKLSQVFESALLDYTQACGHPCCLCTFSYPNSSFQSTLHLICFDTALCKQPHLSVMTLCDLPSLWRVSMFVFWTIAKSAPTTTILLLDQGYIYTWHYSPVSMLKLLATMLQLLAFACSGQEQTRRQIQSLQEAFNHEPCNRISFHTVYY